MIDVLKQMVGYVGDNYPHQKRVASGGNELTTYRLQQCHAEIARKTALMTEDWPCLVILLTIHGTN